MSTHKPRTKQEAHEEALAKSLDDQYTEGKQIDLVVLESPEDNNGKEAYARHNDVAVFIHPGNLNLNVGTHIRAKITFCGENHLKSVAMAILE